MDENPQGTEPTLSDNETDTELNRDDTLTLHDLMPKRALYIRSDLVVLCSHQPYQKPGFYQDLQNVGHEAIPAKEPTTTTDGTGSGSREGAMHFALASALET